MESNRKGELRLFAESNLDVAYLPVPQNETSTWSMSMREPSIDWNNLLTVVVGVRCNIRTTWYGMSLVYLDFSDGNDLDSRNLRWNRRKM